MNTRKTKALFKKAYKYNWDNGIDYLKAVINDKNCDKATALMIFWHGCPDYFYNTKTVESLYEYEKPNYELLKAIEEKVLANTYESLIAYDMTAEIGGKPLGKIPTELAQAVEGKFAYKDILWPNTNPFQEEVFAICQNCTSVKDCYALEAKGADFSKKILNGYSSPITVAVNYGQIEALKYFIEKGFDLNKRYNKEPLLFRAITHKNLDMIQFLLDNGAVINRKGEFRRNLMHHIAGLDLQDKGFDSEMEVIANYLIERGADINKKDSTKRTPLELAKMWENERYVQFLNSKEL